jgi:hypothetical protein
MDANADLVQGYLFARPVPRIGVSGEDHLESLCDRLRSRACMVTDCLKSGLDRYIVELAAAADRMLEEQPLSRACGTLLQDPRVERCYLLDKSGRQVGVTLYPPGDAVHQDARFAPLANGAGASWVRRPYFRRAINEPGVVQTTRPYLSVAGATMCITLSVAIATSQGPQVLCCDLSDT